MNEMTLHLAKENFKFSAAHFLIFDEKHAERLHGHNYKVKVDIKVPQDQMQTASGFFVDFSEIKKVIKSLVDQWDEYVLLPALQPEMKIKQQGSSLIVDFRDRHYVFPANEVVLLPITNTSVEQFSRLLAEKMYQGFKKFNVREVSVLVEETPGQGATTHYRE